MNETGISTNVHSLAYVEQLYCFAIVGRRHQCQLRGAAISAWRRRVYWQWPVGRNSGPSFHPRTIFNPATSSSAHENLAFQIRVEAGV